MKDDRPIYLDHNATTPVAPPVLEAMQPYLTQHYGNPSSGHIYGRSARRGMDRARKQVADLIGTTPGRIIFSSGGTEANNLAILGALDAMGNGASPGDGPGKVVTTAIEHPAVHEPCAYLASQGWEVEQVGVDAGGRLDLQAMEAALDERTCLVSVMHAKNETGVIQPLKEVVEMAHKVGALVHSDAAQSVGKVPIDVSDLGVDLLSMAGHKLYAPKGVGALFVAEGVELSPVIHGSSHESGLRPGTENVASIVGLGEACRWAKETQQEEGRRQAALRDRLWQKLQDGIEDLHLNGAREHLLPNTLNVRFPGTTAGDLLFQVPEIAASGGSACHSGDAQPSSVITAMGVDPQEALGSVRLSLGRCTSRAQIDKVARLLVEAANH